MVKGGRRRRRRKKKRRTGMEGVDIRMLLGG